MSPKRMLQLAAGAALCAILLSCGGGGSSDTALSLALPSIVLDQPAQIIQIPDTGKQPGDTKLEVRFTVAFERFFECVPDGHAGVMLHADLPAIVTTQYRGVGLVFGRLGSNSYTTRNMPQRPLAVLETWAVGAVPDTFDSLLSQTVSPELHDGTYSGLITSEPTPAGNAIGYSLHDETGALVYAADVIDINPVVDMTQPAVVFFNATLAGVALCPYSIRISNLIFTWTKGNQ